MPEAATTVIRGVLAGVAALAVAFAIILLLPGEPCMELGDWRFIRIWPRPDHCT